MSAMTAVLRQPWQARRRSRGLRLYGALLALVLMALGALMAWTGQGWRPWLGLSGLAVLVSWWWSAVEGLVQQNRPDLARLLPGQLRTLRLQLLAHGLVVGLAALGCLGLLLDLRAEWVWAVAASVVMLAWLPREAWLWIPASVLPVLVPWLPVGPLQLLRGVAALPWALQATLFVALTLLLLLVLGDGGPAHRRSYERQKRWAALARAQSEGRPTAATLGPLMRALARCFNWPLAWRRQALLRRPTPHNALARLDLGLQAGGQWPMLLWLLLVLVGGGMGAVLLLVWRAAPSPNWAQVIDASRIGLCAGAFNLLCTPLLSRPAALCGRRREQALLVLLPGVPVGAELASRLEARWRREHLLMWALVSAAVLAVAAQGSPGTLNFAAAASAFSLPLVWLSQRQHRRQQGARPGFGLWMLAPTLVIVPAGLMQALHVPAWASLAGGVLVYATLAWRKRPQQRALLPTGR